MKGRHLLPALCLMGAFALFGCSKDDDSSSGPSQDKGQVQMDMTDAPGDYDHVYVVITRVEAHATASAQTEGWVTLNSQTQTFDMIALQGGNVAAVCDVEIDADAYDQFRLTYGDGCNVVVDGESHALIMANTQTTIDHSFNLAADATYHLTLDFDVDASVHHESGNTYTCNPSFRVAVNAQVGAITGSVLPAGETCHIMAVTISDTISTWTRADGSFTLAFIEEGMYLVLVDPLSINFTTSSVADVEVAAGEVTAIGQIQLGP